MPDGVDGFARQEEVKSLPDLYGFVLVDGKDAVLVIVAGGGVAAAVEVPRLAPADPAHGEALGDLILFQLGKDRQDADHGPAKRGGGIKVFVDGHKVGAMGQQLILDEGQGVLLGTAEPVQLIDHHCVHMGLPDLGEHLLEGGPVCVPAGVAAVHIGVQQHPSLGGTVGFQPGGLLLDGVVLQLVLRGHTGVAEDHHFLFGHGAAPPIKKQCQNSREIINDNVLMFISLSKRYGF